MIVSEPLGTADRHIPKKGRQMPLPWLHSVYKLQDKSMFLGMLCATQRKCSAWKLTAAGQSKWKECEPQSLLGLL